MSLLLLFQGRLAPVVQPPPPLFPWGGHGATGIDGLGRLAAIAPDVEADAIEGRGARTGIAADVGRSGPGGGRGRTGIQ